MVEESTTKKEKESNIREALPFWAKELLAMKDEAEKTRKAP